MNREQIINTLVNSWCDAMDLGDLMDYFKMMQSELLEKNTDKELEEVLNFHNTGESTNATETE